MVNTARLSGERLDQFERDREESNRRYDYAFSVVLSHTSALELQEFSKLVGLGAVGVGKEVGEGSKPRGLSANLAYPEGMATQSHVAEDSPILNQSMQTVLEFEHSNPALGRAGGNVAATATATGELRESSAKPVRSISVSEMATHSI